MLIASTDKIIKSTLPSMRHAIKKIIEDDALLGLQVSTKVNFFIETSLNIPHAIPDQMSWAELWCSMCYVLI